MKISILIVPVILSCLTEWYDFMSCRSLYTGRAKRLRMKETITSENDDRLQVWLPQFLQWLDKGNPIVRNKEETEQLTRFTYLSIKHTGKAILEMVPYIFQEVGNEIQYIMLGKFTSDYLENHFGWLRVLAGVQYTAPVATLMQAEKRIRIQRIMTVSTILYNNFFYEFDILFC